ncbi:MAG: DUF2892 domain-containing protein [Gammaproteobacteria bacterium]|nr:MAG: DUF2892 domain-containing protein [Gammaproteobacteria bacterium]
MKFTKNVGIIDSILRLGVGAGFIYIGFINSTFIEDDIASTILGIFGSIIFVSGALRRCPMYDLIGFNSCSSGMED